MSDLLQVEGLIKQFGGFRAVDGVSFSVPRGSIHSVIGPNGAGKTTLFRLLTGVLSPSAGAVRFDGAMISGRKAHAIVRRGLAQAFQITNIFPRLSVLESVQTAIVARRRRGLDFVTFFDNSRAVKGEALELLDRLGLGAVVMQEARTLSHGDQRVLEVALALATGPRLLLLDEPTAGMSPLETERIVTLVREVARDRDVTVLFSEHDTDVVFGISERITVMHQGRVIAEGTPDEIQRNPEVVAVYLGIDA